MGSEISGESEFGEGESRSESCVIPGSVLIGGSWDRGMGPMSSDMIVSNGEEDDLV